MKFLGLDAHDNYCELAVIDPNGNLISNLSFHTTAYNLIEAVRKVRDEKLFTVEESTLASWIKRVLSPYVNELIISDPKHNKWIASSQLKNDKVDAVRLAQLLRGGYIKPVYHPEDNRQRFKELVLHYHDITHQIVRIKNKIKAKFRQNGIFCKSDSIYHSPERKKWLKKLPRTEVVFQVNNLYRILDSCEHAKYSTKNKISRMAKRYPEIALFQELPGIGLIISATVSAIVDTPFRFATKEKLWAYASLAVVSRESGGKSHSPHLSHQGNRLLKNVIKSAVKQVLKANDNQFKAQYHRLVYEQHITPACAELTVARSILSTMYGMWKKGEHYQPKEQLVNQE